MSEQHAATGGRASAIPWAWIVPMVVGAGIGLSLGARYAWLASGPSSGWMPPTFGLWVLSVLGGGGAMLVGTILCVPSRTRPAGFFIFRALLAAVLGWAVGAAAAPRYQFGGDVLGTLEVRLTSPVAATVSSQAICGIEDNGTSVRTVGARNLGLVGIDRLSASVDVGTSSGRIVLLVNEGAGYEGSIAIRSADPDKMTATGSFTTSHAGRYLLGGDAPALAGEFSWTCSQEPAPSPEPDLSRVSEDPMQGWFSLSGVVDMPHPCSGDGPCLPYGRAMAMCYRAVPYRANHIETVVPWMGESRAHLTLELDPGTAVLTVQVDDGSAAEVVRGKPTVVERGGGMVDRTVSADFDLAAGPLHVEVEYSCSSNVEP